MRYAGLLLGVCLVGAAATIFDLSKDFSTKTNRSGAWQYGYSATRSLDLAEFREVTYSAAASKISFWHPESTDKPGPGYYPYIAYNPTDQTQYGSSNGWAARAGEVALEASNSGQYSLIRFTAPRAGVYEVTAQFAGIHFGLSSTDVHVLHNAVSLFDAEIEGYGGDPGFHKIEGANPTAQYSDRIELKAGDIVTFACGYGKNKTHYGDTTGLFARIVAIP